MRNLKKILALVLALVMSMSLVTIANASDFTDADDITYEEATDVMSAIGVIEGFEDGSFDPNGTLTREQAAKLVTFMLLGNNANNLGVEGSTFDDVAATRWSASAIEYCASLGLIDGAGDGNFYPAGQLTANAFAKILLTALGYSSEKEGMTGTSWSVNVAALAMEVGLDNGIENLSWNAVLTREEAAQMALNAIKAPLVAYENDVTIVVGDTPVSFGSGDAYYVTTTLAREQRIGKDTLSNTNEYTVEFGERYFPNLRLDSDPDEFMRPAYTWVYNSKEIGSYVDYATLEETYTTKVTGRDLYELLSASTIREYDLTYYVDGAEPTRDLDGKNGVDTISKNELYRNNTSKVGRTGNGVLTQVFVDHDAEEITITSINTYLAKANGNYNEKSENISLQVYNNGNGTAKIVDLDDVPAIAGLQEGDFVLVNWASATDGTNKAVVKVTEVPEVMSDVTVTRFSKYDDDTATSQNAQDRVTAITTGGEEYDANKNAFYEAATLGDYDGDLLTNKTYDIYLDQYGYFIGAALHSGDDQYVFIAAYDVNDSAMGLLNADALAIFTDGRMEQIKVNTRDTNKNIDTDEDGNSEVANYAVWDSSTGCNRWFTYTESNGIYTLKPATNYTINSSTRGQTIQTDRLSLDHNIALANGVSNAYEQRSFGNEDSIYITVEQGTSVTWGDVMDEVTGVYTGVDSVRLLVGSASNDYVYAVYDKDNYIIAAIVVGEAEGAVDNYAYVLSGANSEGRDSDGNYYWTFDAILNGEIQEMTIKSKYANTINNLYTGEVEELVLDAEGYVTKINRLDDNNNSNGMYARVTKNEVYDNTDLNAGTDVTAFDVYHVNVNGVTLHLDGRTLHLNNQWDQTGLFFASDAKAIVRQKVNGSWSNTEYASVREAYSTLSDSDSNTTNGLNFQGEVVAVLDSNGVAQWVFFYDNHGVTSGDRPNYNNGATILNLAHDGTQFTATVASNANITGTTVQWEMEVYQGNVKVGDSGRVTGGNWTANTGYPLSAAGAVPFSGTYRVVVSIYKDGVLAASGENTFTVNP